MGASTVCGRAHGEQEAGPAADADPLFDGEEKRQAQGQAHAQPQQAPAEPAQMSGGAST